MSDPTWEMLIDVLCRFSEVNDADCPYLLEQKCADR